MRSGANQEAPAARRWPRLTTLIVTVALACLCSVTATFSAENKIGEQEEEMKEWYVIGGYLFNFTKEAIWRKTDALPENAPYLIGLMADRDPCNAIEKVLTGRLVDKSPIQIVRGTSPEDFADCRIIFVAEPNAAKKVAAFFSGQPKLIVAYKPKRFGNTDCGIELVMDKDNRIRWVLNSGALKAQGIEPSRKLWELAVARPKASIPEAPTPKSEDARKDKPEDAS